MNRTEFFMMNRKSLIFLLLLGMLTIGIFAYGVYWLSYDLERIPRGTLITESTSPNKTYTIKAYTSDAGATTSFSVVAELHFNKVTKKPKVIYFQYKESKASIRWKDDHTVIINDVELELPNEKYDYRRN